MTLVGEEKDETGMQHSPTTDIDPQKQSTLFQMPPELRRLIYLYLFGSTRLSWGSKRSQIGIFVEVKPAPHSLAILRTCRRMKQEIGDTWISQVLFGFEDPWTLFDKLDVCPSRFLRNMRHCRLTCDPLMVAGKSDEEFVDKLNWTIRLLEKVRLHTMTILAYLEPQENYSTLTKIVQEGRGWKELYYITQDSQVLPLSSLPGGHESVYDQKLVSWQSQLEARDGLQCKPTIAIHLSTHPASISENSSERLARNIFDDEAKYFNEGFYAGTMGDGEKGREIMIAIKRGGDGTNF